MEKVATIEVFSDGKQITARLKPQGDEGVGRDVVAALRHLASVIDDKVARLKFATNH